MNCERRSHRKWLGRQKESKDGTTLYHKKLRFVTGTFNPGTQEAEAGSNLRTLVWLASHFLCRDCDVLSEAVEAVDADSPGPFRSRPA